MVGVQPLKVSEMLLDLTRAQLIRFGGLKFMNSNIHGVLLQDPPPLDNRINYIENILIKRSTNNLKKYKLVWKIQVRKQVVQNT